MTLPAWLDPLLDAAQMRAVDAHAIDRLGLPGERLMERAGAALARVVADRAREGRIAVICGKGNNGGDGYVAARILHDQGREVEVMLTASPAELRDDARDAFERLGGRVPVSVLSPDPAGLVGVEAIVDCVLGTGSSGAAGGAAAVAIAVIVAAGAREVIACDVPSGVDASTGEVSGPAVRATATVAFHTAKPGLWIAPGKGHAGEVVVSDIGIPPEAAGAVEPAVGLIEDDVAATIPRRDAGSTKFGAGSVLVCGGSPGLTGATCLAAEAAMRAGAGYVTACVPASLNAIFESRLLEVMTARLPDQGGVLGGESIDVLLERAERADVLVLGPGLGRGPSAMDMARRAARRVELPLVLDADGLNAHAGRLEEIALRGGPTVLTPHGGELARLLEIDSTEVRAGRLRVARAAADRAQAIVLLKGDDTIVACPDGRAAISRGGVPALATAGTGDVLSGVIGALLSKGMEPFDAACAGVQVHLRAGLIAADWIGEEGVVASDVVAALPAARRSLPAGPSHGAWRGRQS